MIVLILGTDTKVRDEAREYIARMGATSHRLGAEDLEEARAIAESEDLFDPRPKIISIEGALSQVKSKEEVKERIEFFAASKHIFVFDDLFPLPSVKKDFAGVAQKIFDGVVKKESQKTFPFDACNALAKKDKKNAWLSVMKGPIEDPELLHGALWWQVKKTWGEVKSGRRGAYSEKEIEDLAWGLVSLWHRSHNGEADMKKEIESLVLNLPTTP